MTTLKAGLTKEELQILTDYVTEFDIWWCARSRLLLDYSATGYNDFVRKDLLELIDKKGLWQPYTEVLCDLVYSSQIKHKFSEWEEVDLEIGWLPIYYDNYAKKGLNKQQNPAITPVVLEQVRLAIDAKKDNDLNKLFKLKDWLYILLSEKICWEDDIPGYPVSEDYFENYGRYAQLCDLHPLQFMEANFIKELFNMYCPNWKFNQRQSKKRVLVYDRPCVFEDYQWQLIIRKSLGQFSGFDSFHVILVKKLPVKLSPLNVAFQAQFPIKALHEFKGDRYMSTWKVDVKHRYMYVERYIDYIEPLISERIQGVEG